MNDESIGVPDEASEVLLPKPLTLDEIEADVAAAEAIYGALIDKLTLPIVADIEEALALISNAENVCIGGVCAVIEDAAKPIDKATTKLAKQVADEISSAMLVLSQYGYPFPSPEDIAYAVATGDYLSHSPPEPVVPVNTDGLTDAAAAVVQQFQQVIQQQPIAVAPQPPLQQLQNDDIAAPFGQPQVLPPIGGNTGATDVPIRVLNPPIVDPGAPPQPPTAQPPGIYPPIPQVGLQRVPILNQFGEPHSQTTDGPFISRPDDSSELVGVLPALLEKRFTVNGQKYDGFEVYQANPLWNRSARDLQILGQMIYAHEPGPFLFIDAQGNRFAASISDQFFKTYIHAIPTANGLHYLVAFFCDPEKPLDKTPCGGATVEPPVVLPPGGEPQPPNVQPPTVEPPVVGFCDGVQQMIPRFDTIQECRDWSQQQENLAEGIFKFSDWRSTLRLPEPNVGGNVITSGVASIVVGALNFVIGAVVVLLTWPFMLARWVIDKLTCAMDCDMRQLATVVPLLSFVNLINKICFGTLNFFVRPWQHAVDKTCPYELPSVDAANAAYLQGTIDKDLWECWVKSQGTRTKPQEKIIEAARARPNIHEVTTLFLREKITEQEWKDAMRGLGVTTDLDRDRYKQLIQAFPGVDDVIRFMVRDVADQKAEDRFKLSAEFENKWAGTLLKYARALGISDDLAKDYWKAHWQLPSNTQLFTINHLFGPHRDDIPEAERLKAEDIPDTIRMNDMLPFWVDKLLASSFNHLTRVDAQRAFRIGAIDEAQLRSAYLDIGYNPKNADILVNFTKQLGINAAKELPGLPTKKSTLKRYIQGEITLEEMTQEMLVLGMKPIEVLALQDRAQRARDIRRQQQAIAGIKKLYIAGILDDTEAMEKLTDSGVSAGATDDLLGEWEILKVGKERLPSVQQLCKWASNGWISREQHLKALKSLRYSDEVAELLAADCAETAAMRLQQAAAREQARQERIREKLEAKEQRDLQKLQQQWMKIADEILDQDLTLAKKIDKIDKWFKDRVGQLADTGA